MTIPRVLALLATAGAALPSATNASDWTVGARGGVSWSQPAVREGDPLPVNGLFGLSGGGYVGYRFTETLKVDFDVLYTRKRFSSEEFVTDSPVESAWIDAPITLEYVIGSSTLRPALVAGLQFGLKLSASRDFRGEVQDIDTELSDFDYGVLIGGRIDLLSTPGRLTAEGRLHWGFENLDRTNWYEIRSRAVTFLISYGLR